MVGLGQFVDLVKVVTALIVLGFLGYEDLKTRELSAVVVYAYLAVGVVLFIITVLTSPFPLVIQVVYIVFSLVASAGLFTLLYKLGLVGDGDLYVSIALGFTFSHPSLYWLTLVSAGIMPPVLIIVLYASFICIVYMLVNAVVVLAKYREAVRSLQGRYRLILPLIGKPVKLSEYTGGKYVHYFPLQYFEVSNGVAVTKYKVLTRVEEGDEATTLRKLVESGLVNPNTYIWVTPGIPFVFYLFLGLILLLVLGDLPVVTFITTLFSGA